MKALLISTLLLITTVAVSQETGSSISKAQADTIVREHNKWRSLVEVDNLTWSQDLAIESQKWADKLASSGCRFYHSNTENGENIYYRDVTGTVLEPVQSWSSESDLYRGGVFNENSTEYGHYTQIVWRDTKQLGCGMAVCKDGTEIWVCQYFPAGNWIGEKPY